MDFKAVSRDPKKYVRQTSRDFHPVHQNFDPDLHPFQEQREYVRALNAVKLDRVFAKPFIASLDGHKDCLSTLEKNPRYLSMISSGSCDGEIRLWNLPLKKCLSTLVAHDGVVRDLCFTMDGLRIISVGDDKLIKSWKVNEESYEMDELAINSVASKHLLCGISHHRNDSKFVTCGDNCTLWEHNRNEPIKVFNCGYDQFLNVSFNQTETDLVASCSTDRSIVLYDIRTSDPIRKIVMTLRPNKIVWNPIEAFMFTCANEDYNLYSFDCRYMKSPVNIYMDHTSAVIDCDYSPTGKEIVSGSYDKTIRIFSVGKGHSREVYHTKRMQRLTGVLWSNDNKFIISASDEMNIRLWKAYASEKLGPMTYMEKRSVNYNNALKRKYSSHPQIKRIARHRQVPRHVFNAQKEIRSIKNKIKLKEANRKRHSKPATLKIIREKDKHVLLEEE